MARLEFKVFAEPSLIGRERELGELQQYLLLAIEGKGTTVFISGKAGVGKTRFINEFLRAAKQKTEIATFTGWCLSDAAIPYFPFIEAFSTYFSVCLKEDEELISSQQPEAQSNVESTKQTMSEESEIKEWLIGSRRVETTDKPGILSPQAWKDLTFAAVTKALLSISAKKPTILVIDDLHWADSASLALLRYISRAIASERVLVLATFRSEELSPDKQDNLTLLLKPCA